VNNFYLATELSICEVNFDHLDSEASQSVQGCCACTKCSARRLTNDVADKCGESHKGIPLYNSRDCYGQFKMYKRDMQSVLRCGQCNKPFDERELYFHQI
jgi:hypothetical protein